MPAYRHGLRILPGFADISRAGIAGVRVARLEDDDPGKPGGQRRR
jgi:hypothetical protein